MCAILLKLISIIAFFDYAAPAAQDIAECVKPGGGAARPSTPPCHDIDHTSQAFCTATFVTPIAGGAAAMVATWTNPTVAYQVSNDCPTYKDLAIEMCPNTCGYCCKLKKFDCEDVDPQRCTAFATDRQLCNQLPEVALEKCPFTCAKCDKKGAGGGCPDSIKNCSPELCLIDELKKLCGKTCRDKSCLTDKSSEVDDKCSDARTGCDEYIDLCNHPDYSSDMSDQCKKTCNAC